ncbi:ankyrin repeat domain-containing protein [Pararhizobium sp. DWP1-1-3]|uniref:ankyrin repeat domain-containing protein n=1 Tax=Pararhizobium sp. DWP1-1-3 TaxID=2804652 RepID=UPI003CFA6F0A
MKFLYTSVLGFAFWVSAATAGPLHEASSSGDVENVKQLLDQGIDVAEPDSAGDPPLILAALAGHTELVAVLLERGANIEVRNKSGLTALHAAAYGGSLDVVKLLVAEGATVNDNRNFFHMTPLHAAAEEGHANVVEFLLANNATVDAKERNGVTPLTQAGWREHWDAADLLLKAGAVCQQASVVGEWLYTECRKRK